MTRYFCDTRTTRSTHGSSAKGSVGTGLRRSDAGGPRRRCAWRRASRAPTSSRPRSARLRQHSLDRAAIGGDAGIEDDDHLFEMPLTRVRAGVARERRHGSRYIIGG